MNPLMIAGLGSSILGSLFGGGQQVNLKDLERILSLQGISGDANKLFELLKGSAFGQHQLLQGSLQGARVGQNLRRTAALAGGATSSPFAALARSGASVTQGLGRSQAMSGLFDTAFGAAQARRSQLAQLAAGLSPQPSPFGQALGTIGQTLGDFGTLKALNQQQQTTPYDLFGGFSGQAMPFGPGIGFQPPVGQRYIPQNQLQPRK